MNIHELLTYLTTLVGMLMSSVVLAFIILGVYSMMYEGMILGWLYNFLEKIFRDKDKIGSKFRTSEGLLYIAKPIYACPPCMSSLWGLPVLVFFPFWQWLIIVTMSVFITKLFHLVLINNE